MGMNRTPARAGRRVRIARLGVAALAVGVGAAGMAAEDEWVSADVFDVWEQGAALSEAGESGKAVTLLRGALADLDRPADIAHVSLWLAQEHLAARDWQAARETLRTVVGLAEHLPAGMAERSWNNLATATFQVGDYADVVRVVADWHGSVADPAAKSWRVLSYAHHRQGDYERALDAGLSYADGLRNDGRLVPASFAGSLRFLRYAVEAQGIPAAAGPGAAKALDAANQQIRAGLPLAARDVLSEALASPGLGPTDASLLREKLAWAFQILGNHERVRELLSDVVESSDRGAELPVAMYNRTLLRYGGVSNLLGDHRRAAELADEWRRRVPQPSLLERHRYLEVAATAHLNLGTGVGIELGREFLALLEEMGQEEPAAFAEIRGALGAGTAGKAQPG